MLILHSNRLTLRHILKVNHMASIDLRTPLFVDRKENIPAMTGSTINDQTSQAHRIL